MSFHDSDPGELKRMRIEAFKRRRLGIFFHWGLYSMLGGRWKGVEMDYIGEWAQSYFRIPNAEYAELAAQFNPVGFDAEEWIRRVSDMGAKYIVFTTKHHDGFAMYHSRADSFNIVDATPFGRDPLRELADACGRHGVALGIYYSQNLDWHHPDGRDPGPDQPKNLFGMSWGNDWDYPDYGRKDFQRYFRQKCLPQVRELLTGYGPVCEFWGDCGFNMSEDESRELSDMIHGLQPGCVINSRISPDSRFRDFASLGDNQDMHGRSSEPVESPITLNDTWGFKYSDQNWKSPRLIAERMAALADRDANLLLNIGTDGMGRFPDGTVKVLDELARWHRRHPGAIAGTTPNPFPQDFAWGSCTQSGKRLNFFIREPRESIVIHGLKGRIAAASCPCEEAPGALVLRPEYDVGELLPVVTVDFVDTPAVDQNIFLDGDGTELAPCFGRANIGDEPMAIPGTAQLDVAAELVRREQHLHIGADGSALDWHNPSDSITWSIRVTEPGSYQVSLVTFQSGHSMPWVGKRTVEVFCGAQTICAKLEATEPVRSYCYAAARSEIGVLVFPKPGVYEVGCRTTAIEPDPLAFAMCMQKLTLARSSQ